MTSDPVRGSDKTVWALGKTHPVVAQREYLPALPGLGVQHGYAPGADSRSAWSRLTAQDALAPKISTYESRSKFTADGSSQLTVKLMGG